MKRMISILCVALIVFSFAGCQKKATATVNFYYRTTSVAYNTQTSVIQPEQRSIDINLSDLEGILKLYLDGPNSGKFESPFPSGTVLRTVQAGKDVTSVVLSNHISKLSGIELMISCACLATTVLEISQSQTIQIRAESELLNNSEYLEFTAENLQLFA